MDILTKIYGKCIGAEIAITIKNGKVAMLYGKITKKMLHEIQTTCQIHQVKSGHIFFMKNFSKYAVKTDGDALKIAQSLMNVINLC